jgi:hypothetical protein
VTAEDVQQEIDRRPFVPLRLHLASGRVIEIPYEGSAWVRRNTLLVLERLSPTTSAIGGYDVIALSLIERIQQINGSPATPRSKSGRRKGR